MKAVAGRVWIICWYLVNQWLYHCGGQWWCISGPDPVMETTSSMNKVGPLIFSLLVHVSIAQVTDTHVYVRDTCHGCDISLFRQEYCNLNTLAWTRSSDTCVSHILTRVCERHVTRDIFRRNVPCSGKSTATSGWTRSWCWTLASLLRQSVRYGTYHKFRKLNIPKA